MKPRRPSLRETQNATAAALRGWMRMAGKPIPQDDPLFQDIPPPARKVRTQNKLPTEHQEQVAFVRWFHVQFPSVKIFAVPNAAVRDERLAAWMKAEGLAAGVPDLCIPAWNLWIEMKRQKGGTVSPDQAEWIAYLNAHGHRAVVCKGFDDARRAVAEHLKVNGTAQASAVNGVRSAVDQSLLTPRIEDRANDADRQRADSQCAQLT